MSEKIELFPTKKLIVVVAIVAFMTIGVAIALIVMASETPLFLSAMMIAVLIPCFLYTGFSIMILWNVYVRKIPLLTIDMNGVTHSFATKTFVPYQDIVGADMRYMAVGGGFKESLWIFLMLRDAEKYQTGYATRFLKTISGLIVVENAICINLADMKVDIKEFETKIISMLKAVEEASKASEG